MSEFRPQRILCALDLSPASDAVAAWAGLLARTYDARVTFVHADWSEPPRYFLEEQISAFIALGVARRQALERELLVLVQKHVAARIPREIKIITGHALEVIRAQAHETAADLIVMGSHGHSRVARFLMGSVAENVVREAHIPTLIVKAAPAAGARRIVCPVNQTEVAKRCTELSLSLSATLGAELTLLRAAEERTSELDAMQQQLCSSVPEESRRRCAFSATVLHGDPAERIVQFARENDVDLIVIGAQHRPFLEFTAFGQTTERVLRHSTASVLVVPRLAGTAADAEIAHVQAG